MSNPFDTAIGTARMLADVADYVPSDVLDAAAEALARAADNAFNEVQSQRGRRGNPAKRDQAWRDVDSAAALRAESRERSRILLAPVLSEGLRPAWSMWLREIETAPDLGAQQWAVVAATASTWSGTPADLYMVAKATVPGEQPLDLQVWLLGHRRRRSRNRVREAEQRVKDHLSAAQQAMEAARDATQRALEHRGSAERWVKELSMRQEVAYLTDEDLAAYESAIGDGVSPAEALAAALSPQQGDCRPRTSNTRP